MADDILDLLGKASGRVRKVAYMPPDWDAEEQDDETELSVICDRNDVSGFVDWVEANAEARGLADDSDGDIYLLSKPQERAYERLLAEAAPQLAPLMNEGMPRPLCRSELSESGIKIPKALIRVFPIDEILDEYFGLCYNPHREEDFDPGTKAELQTLIREKIPDIGGILASNSDLVLSVMSVNSASAVDDIYGPGSVAAWVKAHGVPKGWHDWGIDEYWDVQKNLEQGLITNRIHELDAAPDDPDADKLDFDEEN